MISILIPYYNKSKTISKVIQSIENARLKAPQAVFEVIIVDDGSAFNEQEVLRRETMKLGQFVKIVSKINGGVSSARNLAINHSIGEYIYFLDADDLIDQDFFQNVKECDSHQAFRLKINNSVMRSFSNGCLNVNEEIFLELYLKRLLHLSSFVFRKNKIATIFNEKISVGEDILFIYQNIIGVDVYFSRKFICTYCYDGKFHHSGKNGLELIARFSKDESLIKQLNSDIEFKNLFYKRLNGFGINVCAPLKFSFKQALLLIIGSGAVYKVIQILRYGKLR